MHSTLFYRLLPRHCKLLRNRLTPHCKRLLGLRSLSSQRRPVEPVQPVHSASPVEPKPQVKKPVKKTVAIKELALATALQAAEKPSDTALQTPAGSAQPVVSATPVEPVQPVHSASPVEPKPQVKKPVKKTIAIKEQALATALQAAEKPSDTARQTPAGSVQPVDSATPVEPVQPVHSASPVEPKPQVKKPVKKTVAIKELSFRGTVTGASATEGTQAQSFSVVTVALVVVATLLLSLVVPLLHYLISWDPTAPKVTAFCRTPDCTAFGREVSLAINPAIDPCHDFHGFVCGGWKEPRARLTTEARMITEAYDMAIKRVKDDPQRVSKVAQFFRSCTRAGTHKSENLRQFAELRKVLSLTWPEGKPQGVRPLEVMVNLALNWQMNFPL
ncbi:hypothetical protein MTO96_032091 [Rhipicephalus appendiculatus]